MNDPVRRRPTMMDVADSAGVSRALVSIVMRDAPGASDQTRAHVKEVAARLGYTLDARARALRSRSAGAIGVAFRLGQAFHVALVEAIYEAAAGTGQQVVLSAITSVSGERGALEALVAQRCGALVVLEPHLPAQQLVEVSSGLPVLVMASTVEAPGVSCITSDDHGGMLQAFEYLVRSGHRRVWFAESRGSGGNPERRSAFEQGCSGHLGVTGAVVEGGNTESAGAGLAERFLRASQRPDAVICFNDACAAGFQDVLVRAGVRVPDDVSVVGFDDAPLAGLGHRDLTTVRQDLSELARRALVESATQMDAATAPGSVVRVPTQLVVRSSVAQR